jgi:hypothetical protein
LKQSTLFGIIYIVKKGLEKVKGQTEMKIYGLKSFVKKLQRRLVKEIDYKQEPFVAVDGIKIDYIGDGKPLISVSLRVGYQFNDNHYQSKGNIDIDADGNNLEYIAGVFATKFKSTEFEMY